MKVLLSFLVGILFLGKPTSIYSFSITSVDSQQIDFSNFRGKKILLVNIATSSPRANQIGSLQTLYSQYSDSLVVVAFPSNSFGFESRSNAEIKAFCDSEFGTRFYIAGKGDVTGEQRQPIFNWLGNTSENGVASTEVYRDFHKFLIDTDGSLIGLFSHSVDPMDSVIQKAILGIE